MWIQLKLKFSWKSREREEVTQLPNSADVSYYRHWSAKILLARARQGEKLGTPRTVQYLLTWRTVLAAKRPRYCTVPSCDKPLPCDVISAKMFVLLNPRYEVTSVADSVWLFIPDPGSNFFPSRIPYPNFFHPGSASKNLSILTPKMVSKRWEIWSGLFIPDPDPAFFPSRIQGSKMHLIPGPDPQHWKLRYTLYFLSRCAWARNPVWSRSRRPGGRGQWRTASSPTPRGTSSSPASSPRPAPWTSCWRRTPPTPCPGPRYSQSGTVHLLVYNSTRTHRYRYLGAFGYTSTGTYRKHWLGRIWYRQFG